MSKSIFIEIGREEYAGPEHLTLKREFGVWVLRNGDGEVIDQDAFRNDLLERHNARIFYKEVEHVPKSKALGEGTLHP